MLVGVRNVVVGWVWVLGARNVFFGLGIVLGDRNASGDWECQWGMGMFFGIRNVV